MCTPGAPQTPMAQSRGKVVRAGIWLGLLSAAQLFTGEELLAQTAIVGLVLVIALAASHPRAVRARGSWTAPSGSGSGPGSRC